MKAGGFRAGGFRFRQRIALRNGSAARDQQERNTCRQRSSESGQTACEVHHRELVIGAPVDSLPHGPPCRKTGKVAIERRPMFMREPAQLLDVWAALAPLSVQSGGSPMPSPIMPTRPGARPNTSHAGYLGAPPSCAPSLSIDGTDGSPPNGVFPVTRSLLKSSPNATASV